ncbi:SDR family oxidoreductase [Protaetiibacter intestinalis]|uniref:NAD-dependent epimerase/dehydratase family protein n=1 Tax=Protaetiibacter intestinalis TaxID=2419774 RepID=A0A387B3H4_9MICO|nr:NAD(P)H-binding protein [Protaetiibacter intestinalis]AYF96847.1 NAD-dependent epimerase/dehydratase family protein [Protaetiibacter intestinalis]
MTILVTGGTGRLGRHAVDALRARGHEPRILSRRPGADHIVADLGTGEGLAAALDGVDTVLHLATTRSKDIGQTRMLLDAMAGTGAHLVFISIVGVDRAPYAYYRDKVASEEAIAASGVPHTIIRVTQFHGFVSEFLDAQRRLPVTVVVPATVQTIHMPEVAARLAELVDARPAGRVADLGGPELLTLREHAVQWQQAHGIRRPIWSLRLPGRFARAAREGGLTSGLPGGGRVTFREYLAEELGNRATNGA